MPLSQAKLIDIRDTCDRMVVNVNAAAPPAPAMILVAELAAATVTLAEMVKGLAEEAARG